MSKTNKRQKKKQIKMRNKKLIKKYPFLLPRSCWTGKVPKDYDYSYTEYGCLSKGWKAGFGEFLLEDLRNACVKTNFLDKLFIMQWKEKYGSMRLYINGAPEEVHEVIRKYEFISEYICYQCGSPHACVVNDYGLKELTVLSLFDGISCGQVALQKADIPIKKYFSSEVDKYAIQITQKNYPSTIQLGDVSKITYKDGTLYTENEKYCIGKDKGLLLKDIVREEDNDKYHLTKMHHQAFLKSYKWTPNYLDEKSKPLLASYYKQPPHCPYISCEQSESGYRMLSPIECERLQTLPDNYTEGVSKTQRYKCIGNGWTVDVIAWILSYLK